MRVYGDYASNGYALVKRLLDKKVTNAILSVIAEELRPNHASIDRQYVFAPVLNRPSFEKYGPEYTPLKFLVWGMTPIMEKLIKVPLDPSYNFFRIYRGGDVCKVHSDRPSCEHSMSLTLQYSDGKIWPFDIGLDSDSGPRQIRADFDGAEFKALKMQPGDAVIYRGVETRHGRVSPNPNEWSAHIFFHWVERGGRYAESAFECGSSIEPVEFNFLSGSEQKK